LVSVNYEAKACGVTRNMKVKEAKSLCPNIKIFEIPEKYGKPYQRKYFEASEQVFDVISSFINKIGTQITVQKASVDEVYLDMTQLCNEYIREGHTYHEEYLRELGVAIEGGKRPLLLSNGYNMKRSTLTHGAVLMTELCDEIYNKTGFETSAGISYNKLLAKTACSFNRPNGITIIATQSGIARVFKDYKIENIDGLGGRFGSIVKNTLKISTIQELRRFQKNELINIFGKRGVFLWNAARGIDNNAVTQKTLNDSISSKRRLGILRVKLLVIKINFCN
jgi:DNA polymerase eta